MGCNCVKLLSNDSVMVNNEIKSHRANSIHHNTRNNKITSDNDDSHNRTGFKNESPLLSKINTGIKFITKCMI